MRRVSVLHYDIPDFDETDGKPKKSDNRCLAILFINVFAACAVTQGLIWKIAAKQGGHFIDFQILRCLCILLVAIVQTAYVRINPFISLPKDSIKDMIIRSLGG